MMYGTGIFTKCLIDSGLKKITIVEPNKNMLRNLSNYPKKMSPF